MRDFFEKVLLFLNYFYSFSEKVVGTHAFWATHTSSLLVGYLPQGYSHSGILTMKSSHFLGLRALLAWAPTGAQEPTASAIGQRTLSSSASKGQHTMLIVVRPLNPLRVFSSFAPRHSESRLSLCSRFVVGSRSIIVYRPCPTASP